MWGKIPSHTVNPTRSVILYTPVGAGNKSGLMHPVLFGRNYTQAGITL